MLFRGIVLFFIAVTCIVSAVQDPPWILERPPSRPFRPSLPDKYKCRTEGWMRFDKKCYKWGVSPRTFNKAIEYCDKLNATLQNIETEKENNYFREEGGMEQTYWLGFRRIQKHNDRYTFSNEGCWSIVSSTSCRYGNYSNWQNTENSEIGSCAMRSSVLGIWTSMPRWQCASENKLFLCEQPAVCKDSYFGPDCSKQSHCYGETYGVENSHCKYGCQRGWTGDTCSKRKLKPKALYYCFNTKTGGKRIVFRADQKGTNFRHVRAVDANNKPISTCMKSKFKQTGDYLSINIVSSKDGFQPKCGETKISDDVIKWKIEFKEFARTRSAYDVIFEATCNFLSSDSLQRSAQMVNKKQDILVDSLYQSNFTVDLRIVDPYTEQDIKSSPLGAQAKLVLSLHGSQPEIGVQGILPHTCTAATEDDKESVQLMDEHGCQTNGSQIIFDYGNGTNWWSKPFELFTFPGYDHVTITCLFHVCFKENSHYCKVENMCNIPLSLFDASTTNNRRVGAMFSVK